MALITLTACAPERTPPTAESEVLFEDVAIELATPVITTPVTLLTYEGSNQVVHPDVAVTPSGWSSASLFLAATPYPKGESIFENPSLWSGTDGLAFAPAPGAPAPLVRADHGHLSDPDLVYDPSARELRLYYRQAVGIDQLWMIRSRDGRSWSAPLAIFDVPGSGALSPAVVRRARDSWWMWTVNASNGCAGATASVELRRSKDGLGWDAPVPVVMSLPAGLSPWHIEVQWIAARKEYWAVFPVKSAGSCMPTAIYLASSADGVAWRVVPTPLLITGESEELRDIVYRSTFAYHATSDAITFWYSGARATLGVARWSVAVQQRSRADAFALSGTVRATPIPRPDRALAAQFDPP